MFIIMSRNKIKSVQRIFIFFFVSLSFVWAENEVTLTSTIKNKCNDKILSWDMSPATMQNLAYMWTHQQKMEQWHYEEDKSRPVPMTFLLFPDAECRLIEYETMVLVPRGFSRIIPGKVLSTHILKKVCATSKDLEENVTFSNIILLGSFKIKMKANIDNEKKQTLFILKCDLVLPWFALPFKSKIHEHIQNSMLEYIELLSNSLCT